MEIMDCALISLWAFKVFFSGPVIRPLMGEDIQKFIYSIAPCVFKFEEKFTYEQGEPFGKQRS